MKFAAISLAFMLRTIFLYDFVCSALPYYGSYLNIVFKVLQIQMRRADPDRTSSRQHRYAITVAIVVMGTILPAVLLGKVPNLQEKLIVGSLLFWICELLPAWVI